MPRKTRRRKHIPQRTCIGCREVLPKRTMIRIVRTPTGVVIDPTGKMSGRGAYLHDRKECWENGLKGALAGALRTQLSPEDLVALQAFMVSLAESQSGNFPGPDRIENQDRV